MGGPTRSPWGAVQDCKSVAEGIWSLGTASHGGFKLERAQNAKMPECVRRPGGWYEEDCEWCFIALVFPSCFDAKDRALAEYTCKNGYPDEYTALTGKTLAPEESRTLRERIFVAETRDRFVVRAAWGDWHPGVPAGMIGVFAKRASDSAEAWFMVPRSEYGTGSLHFVIDESRHARTEPLS